MNQDKTSPVKRNSKTVKLRKDKPIQVQTGHDHRSPNHTNSPTQEQLNSPDQSNSLKDSGLLKSPKHGYAKSPKHGYTKNPKYGHAKSPNYGHAKSPKYGHAKSPKYGHVMSPKQTNVKNPKQTNVKSPKQGHVKSPNHDQVKSPRKYTSSPRNVQVNHVKDADGKHRRKHKQGHKNSGSSGVEHDVHDEEINNERGDNFSLERRLEIVASHDSLCEALVGLVTWSNMFKGKEQMNVMYSSNALKLLIENVVNNKTQEESEIKKLLHNFFENILEHGMKNELDIQELATSLVNTIVRVKGEQEVDRNLVILKVVELLKNDHESVLNPKNKSLHALANIKNEMDQIMLKAAQVTGDDIQHNFERRDIVADLVDVSFQHCQMIRELPEVPEKSLEEKELTHDVLTEHIEKAKKYVQSLQLERSNQTQPLNQQMESALEEKGNLNKEKTQLLERIQQIDCLLANCTTTIDKVQDDLQQVQFAYDRDIQEYNDNNEQIVSNIELLEIEQKIDQFVHPLSKKFSHYANDQSTELLTSLRCPLPVALKQYVSSLQRYLRSETLCVGFMKDRVQESTVKLVDLEAEIVEYEALSIATVVEELVANANVLKKNVEEDEQCMKLILRKDAKIFADFQVLVETYPEECVIYGSTIARMRLKFLKLGFGETWELPPSLQIDLNDDASYASPTLSPMRSPTVSPVFVPNLRDEKLDDSVMHPNASQTTKTDNKSTLKQVAMTEKANVMPKLSWAQATPTPPQTITTNQRQSLYDIQAEELAKKQEL